MRATQSTRCVAQPVSHSVTHRQAISRSQEPGTENAVFIRSVYIECSRKSEGFVPITCGLPGFCACGQKRAFSIRQSQLPDAPRAHCACVLWKAPGRFGRSFASTPGCLAQNKNRGREEEQERVEPPHALFYQPRRYRCQP